MKLLVAIVQDEDADDLLTALTARHFRVTRVASTGGLLQTGSTALFLGVDDADVSPATTIVRTVCRRRTEMVVPFTPALEPGLLYGTENFEVEVGGATLITLHVDRFERL
ncbi:MAG TPA: cyclic-di-AMP receptor [Thermomicrobiaceae bacterium]|nr:cyclic-di-AMP receptor [Thermomicrobiaceae bacterium]